MTITPGANMITRQMTLEMPQLHNRKPSVNVYDVNKKQSHSSRKPKNDNIKIISNGDVETKLMVASES